MSAWLLPWLGALPLRWIVSSLLAAGLFGAGYQLGRQGVQQAWDAERLQQRTAALQQSLQVAQVQTQQEQINQRISTDHDTHKTQLQRLWQPPKASAVPVVVTPDSPNSQSVPVDLRTDADRLRDSTSPSNLGTVPAHVQPATGVDAAAAHAVSDPASAQIPVSCEQLASDAAQATLMVLSFQRWYTEHVQLTGSR
ncbi:hypothetical protein [Limnohabitans lacus]|uniref:Uncharacterized protein n=1 Tax=Limnohabitans lacus TaxID=3045173 RepID=A0ABT6X9E1_9BURK|nr:hypothetical protein [Limnohabitans sp. HM2-2]MDI9234740.1 hypothetical protein [Limnohabitans sp. HM2-2]